MSPGSLYWRALRRAARRAVAYNSHVGSLPIEWARLSREYQLLADAARLTNDLARVMR